jgi:thiamine-phosphate pyrophosphorylase
MAHRPLLYCITDRKAFPGDEAARRRLLLEKIAEAARCGVDYIQLREKDLAARELETLAREAVCLIRKATQLRTENRELRTRFLINSRTDVALAVGADGVHLRADDVSPSDVRAVWKCGAGAPSAGSGQAPARENLGHNPIIGVSCHSVDEVRQATKNRADFAVFAPVFEKKDSPAIVPAGLAALQAACRVGIPVFALGGVTLENAQSCLDAGAAGIAAIRLFQEHDIAGVVRTIRG